jgi:hypothetical protein
MNKEKREELKDKRRLLQKELQLRELNERVAPQLAYLEKLGESYRLYYDFENLNWIDSNVRVRNRNGYTGIHGDFQLDVDDSTVASTIDMSIKDLDSDLFQEQFSSLIPDTNSLIVCYQCGDPELEVSTKAFLAYPTLFFSRPETWIITTDKSWVIEYIWEQEVIRFIQLKKSIPTLIKKIIIERESQVFSP